MKIMKFIALLLSVALYCCGNAKEAANHQSNSQMKSMETLSGTYKIIFIKNNTEIPQELSITFDDATNKVSGYSGCNNFFGDYTVEDNSIQFGELGATKRLCKRFMDVEQNMLYALSQVNTFSIENGALTLQNDKTDSRIEATKNNAIRIAQDDAYIIEYIATTRGFYTQVILENGIMSIQKDRDHKAAVETIVCSKEELETLNTLLNEIDLNNLNAYKGPTEKRFYDGAAIANLKISMSGNDYATPSFDHGYPNSNIEAFVNTLTKMAKIPK